MRTQRLLHILVGIFCLVATLQAQTFTATVDAQRILQNSTVNVEFELKNAQGSKFQAPDFKGFQVVGGPNKSTQMTIVNGKSSGSESYGYTLLAPKMGKYTIGSASIYSKGKEYKTKPITIEVIKGSDAPADENTEIYVKAIVSDSTAILGQQVVLSYVLYNRVSVENYDLLNEPDYDGFFAVPLNVRDRTKREIINGKEYYVTNLKKVSLFPQQTGTYTYDPVTVNLGVSDGRRRQRGFFFNRSDRYVRRTTNPIKINVVSAPAGAPNSFSGGIGQYRMAAEIEKNTITTDDAIKINMRIIGTGDPKIVQAPAQDFGAQLEVYEPNILREDQDLDEGFVRTDKVFEYLVVPKQTGRYSISPKFSYYDPDSNAYQTLTAGPFSINVIQGSKAANTLEDLEETRSLAPIIAQPKMVALSGKFYGSIWHWGILGLILLGIPYLLFKKMKLQQLANIDPKVLQMQNAEKVAIANLAQAKSALDAGEKRKYYEEIQNSIFGYLSDRLEVPYSQMNRSDIGQILQSKQIPQELIDSTEEVLRKAELALFAGTGADDMQSSYEETKRIISGIESSLN